MPTVSRPQTIDRFDRITGEQSMVRWSNVDYFLTFNQRLMLTYFTSTDQALTVTTASVVSGSTLANPGPLTLVRFGLYLIDSSNNGSLVASTPNDATLLAATGTAYSKALSVAYKFIPNQRYASAVLQVGGLSGASIYGNTNFASRILATRPRLNAYLDSQTDLPGSFTDVSLAQIDGAWRVEYT